MDNELVTVPDQDVRQSPLTSKVEGKKKTPPIIGIQRGVVWNVEEYEKLQKYMADIRLYRWFGDYDSAFKLTAYLNIFIRRVYSDHRPTLLYKTKVEANDALVGTNKVTSSGIMGIVNTLAGQSIDLFIYMSIGTSTTPETIGQSRLGAHEARLSVLVDGGMGAHGNVWNHAGNFGYGIRTDKYYEWGIHDQPYEPSKMFSRSVLETGLQHYQNETFLTASHSSIFNPK